jgi:DNA-binding response OmpR family regulator
MSKERSEALDALLKPKRILLVEDNPNDAYLAEATLKRNKFEVYVAYTVEQASNLLDSQHFDIVLVDLNLSGKSGIDLIGEYRKKSNTVPCVLISGDTSINKIANEAGIIVALVKPLTDEHIEKILSRL